jgi:hypothetical protein
MEHAFFSLLGVDKTYLIGFIQCVLEVAVHLHKVLEVMITSVYTGLNPFNFIRKHILQICLCDVSYERCYCNS